MTDNLTLPNLAGVVKKDDVFKKGSGSYSAEYISWARIADYLHEHANGYQFHLQMTPDEAGYVWKAPDGTGYVIGYFSNPDSTDHTSDFPFPCMDNRNQPILFEKVSCRTLTDTHRRALCAAAAFTFGLGFELWARAEVAEADSPEPAPAKKAPAKKAAAKAAPAPAAAPADQPNPEDVAPGEPSLPGDKPLDTPLSTDERTLLFQCLKELSSDNLALVVDAFKTEFSLSPSDKLKTEMTTEKHAVFLRAQLASIS